MIVFKLVNYSPKLMIKNVSLKHTFRNPLNKVLFTFKIKNFFF